MPKETATAEIANPDQVAQPGTGWAPADNPNPVVAPESTHPAEREGGLAVAETTPVAQSETSAIEAASGGSDEAWWTAAPPAPVPFESPGAAPSSSFAPMPPFSPTETAPQFGANSQRTDVADIPVPPGGAYFCGDTSFFSLNWALHTIAKQKLTGTLRCFWQQEPVELLARDGAILLATTRDPELYCSEAPITLVNVDPERIAAARERQRQTGRPLFITLAEEGLIIHEPSVQLVQHYGQKMFAQLWSAPLVRFMFETDQLSDYAADFPGEQDVDYWALGTLRFIQFGEIGAHANYDQASIPAYTRDGFDRVQKLRLTVAEAQFASQFNGNRSIAQIAKNLRLDLKFARLTLFRFLALEIIECWPPVIGEKPEKRGVFGRMFGG